MHFESILSLIVSCLISETLSQNKWDISKLKKEFFEAIVIRSFNLASL